MPFDSLIWAIVALGLVVALIIFLSWLVKRAGWATGRVLGRSGRRLRIVEVTPIDVKRKLLLVRRDNVEHLILLGLERDQVVETGIPAPHEDPSKPTSRTEPADLTMK